MLLSMEGVTTPGHVSFRFSLPPLEKMLLAFIRIQ
jgi:hypothetical protein